MHSKSGFGHCEIKQKLKVGPIDHDGQIFNSPAGFIRMAVYRVDNRGDNMLNAKLLHLIHSRLDENDLYLDLFFL
jgi:hypothetical protein